MIIFAINEPFVEGDRHLYDGLISFYENVFNEDNWRKAID